MKQGQERVYCVLKVNIKLTSKSTLLIFTLKKKVMKGAQYLLEQNKTEVDILFFCIL